jgi:hypothetical protein
MTLLPRLKAGLYLVVAGLVSGHSRPVCRCGAAAFQHHLYGALALPWRSRRQRQPVRRCHLDRAEGRRRCDPRPAQGAAADCGSSGRSTVKAFSPWIIHVDFVLAHWAVQEKPARIAPGGRCRWRSSVALAAIGTGPDEAAGLGAFVMDEVGVGRRARTRAATTSRSSSTTRASA